MIIGQIERLLPFGHSQPLNFSIALGNRKFSEVQQLERQCQRRMDDLHRAPILRDKAGAKDLMTSDDHLKSLLQSIGVEHALDLECPVNVV